MISSLHIENYRCFEKFDAQDLGRVNLIVGDNNSGKTSLLEAVYLLMSGYSPHSISRILENREAYIYKDIGIQESRNPLKFYKISSLFNSAAKEKYPNIEIHGSSEIGDIRFQAKSSSANTQTELSIPEILGNIDFLKSGLPHFTVDYFFGNNRVPPYSIAILPGGLTNPVFYTRNDDSNYVRKTTEFLHAKTPKSDQLAMWWKYAFNYNLQEPVIGFVRQLLPDLESIQLINLESGPLSLASFACRMKSQLPSITLSSLGDGVTRAFCLGLTLNYCSNGTLLIDEIDTGLHYSAMQDIWRLIIKYAREWNVQVFATTHSDDCIRGLAWLFEEQPDINEDVRLHRMDTKRGRTVVFKPDELPTIVEGHIEVR